MNKKLVILFFFILFIPISIFADEVTYLSTFEITSNTNKNNETFTSLMGGKNSLLVSGGENTFTSCIFDKKGDSTYSEANYYGTNSSIIVSNGVLNLNGGKINTDGKKASGIFSYGNGKVNVNDMDINTLDNESIGIMVSNGGSIIASKLNVITNGNESPAIGSSYDGGSIVVNGGKYVTNGKDAPVVHSNADITINDAFLESTSSEGVIVDGNGIVTLNRVKSIISNSMLGSNANNYKNIMLYQSEDNKKGNGVVSFFANDSDITTNNGDTIYVTNTKAIVSLKNNRIVNENGCFLKIQASNFGKKNNNGGDVTLNLNNQEVIGDIILDDISTVDVILEDSSMIRGAVNSDNKAKNVTMSLSENSSWILTEDSYITALSNLKKDNKNIYSNGKFKLYVNGVLEKINDNVYDKNIKVESSSQKLDDKKNGAGTSLIVILVIIVLGLISVGVGLFLQAKRNNSI